MQQLYFKTLTPRDSGASPPEVISGVSPILKFKRFLRNEAHTPVHSRLVSRITRKFSDNVLHVFEKSPARLREIEGIGPKRYDQVMQAWQEFKALGDLESFLAAHRLPLDWSLIVWREQGLGSFKYFTDNPYQAVSELGLPFEEIDAFALRYKFKLDSPERLRWGFYDLLNGYYRQGHCAYPEEKLLFEAREKLGILDNTILENALEVEMVNENLVSDTIAGVSCVYLKSVWDLEQRVAKKLVSFERKSPPWGWFNSQKVLGWAQSILNIRLAPLQKEAIDTALSSSLTVITGGPGTGKTTLIRSLVTILETQHLRFALCSPTGRAAQRLEETTGSRAQTIHRLLKYDGQNKKFAFNHERPLDLDLLLIDEASMVDLSLMSSLLDALPKHCALILVGDADQIPPVGAGHVLQSIISSERFKVVKLSEIFRQSDSSLIKINAHRINSGDMPLVSPSKFTDFHYIQAKSANEIKKTILNLVQNVLPHEYNITDPRHVQILTPLNRGTLGTQELNRDLQAMLTADRPSVEHLDQVFHVGDKVMVTKNDYAKDVFNGDIGFVQSINHDDQYLVVDFETRNLRFDFSELDQLTLAYAISVHKSQGSEYRAVIVVVSADHLPLAQRHLIYTAVTRGKEQVFLVADPNALRTAILADENNRRWQKLTELLVLRNYNSLENIAMLKNPTTEPREVLS